MGSFLFMGDPESPVAPTLSHELAEGADEFPDLFFSSGLTLNQGRLRVIPDSKIRASPIVGYPTSG
jgi:hypothetical protein